jgi:hypothetical protein
MIRAWKALFVSGFVFLCRSYTRLERVSLKRTNQSWDVAAGVRHIAPQYAVDHQQLALQMMGDSLTASLFLPAIKMTWSLGFDYYVRPCLRDLRQRVQTTIITDDSQQSFHSFSLPDIPSLALAARSRDGKCKRSDLIPPPDLRDFRSFIGCSSPDHNSDSMKLAPRSPGNQ